MSITETKFNPAAFLINQVAELQKPGKEGAKSFFASRVYMLGTVVLAALGAVVHAADAVGKTPIALVKTAIYVISFANFCADDVGVEAVAKHLANVAKFVGLAGASLTVGVLFSPSAVVSLHASLGLEEKGEKKGWFKAAQDKATNAWRQCTLDNAKTFASDYKKPIIGISVATVLVGTAYYFSDSWFKPMSEAISSKLCDWNWSDKLCTPEQLKIRADAEVEAAAAAKAAAEAAAKATAEAAAKTAADKLKAGSTTGTPTTAGAATTA